MTTSRSELDEMRARLEELEARVIDVALDAANRTDDPEVKARIFEVMQEHADGSLRIVDAE